MVWAKSKDKDNKRKGEGEGKGKSNQEQQDQGDECNERKGEDKSGRVTVRVRTITTG